MSASIERARENDYKNVVVRPLNFASRGDKFCDQRRSLSKAFPFPPGLFITSGTLKMVPPTIDRNKYHLLHDLPKVMQNEYFKNIDKILELHEKFEKNSALQSYFQRNSLFQLQKITKRNNEKIKRKLTKLIDFQKSECVRKLKLHRMCVANLKEFIIKYRECEVLCDLKSKDNS